MRDMLPLAWGEFDAAPLFTSLARSQEMDKLQLARLGRAASPRCLDEKCSVVDCLWSLIWVMFVCGFGRRKLNSSTIVMPGGTRE